jgi:hypothetical protein
MSTFAATLRYEFRMQVRKRTVWIAPTLLAVLFVLIGGRLIRDLFDATEARRAPKAAMLDLALGLNVLLPVAFGCLLADRLIRDDRLRVAPILDATPARRGLRLAGKYLGTATATALPIAVIYAGLAAAYAVYWGKPAALPWAVAGFGLVIAPALLFVAAFALTVPLLMPAPLFRVLFVGYWFWGNLIDPEVMPTLARSIVQPVGGYALNAVFHHYGGDGQRALSGPFPGATLNFLRPEPSALAGWLSIAVLLALAAAALAGGRAVRERRAY